MVENSATNNQLPSHDVLPQVGSQQFDDDGRPKRTGTVWTASAYILTAVSGPVVLSLAWDFAQLGWVAGPVMTIFFSFVTYYTSTFLCASYRSPDTGKRNHTYMDAVRSNFDGAKVKICWVIEHLNLFVLAGGFTTSASILMMDISWYSKCHSSDGVDPCYVYRKPHYMAFAVAQIFLSQIPNFSQLRWFSILCLVMFLLYSGIGLGLAIAKVAENGNLGGSLAGIISIGTTTRAQKIWTIFRAVGDIAQAYDFSAVLIEIEDTVKSSPSEPEVKTMKKATRRSIAVTTFVSMLYGCMGYAVFGESSPDFLLSGFYKPYWLLNIASAAIVIQYAGGYQIYSQPIFGMVEKAMAKRFPENEFITKDIKIPILCFGPYKLNLFRLVWRTVFVITTTVLSMFLAIYFDLLKLIQILAFWPIAVYFPVEMYIVQKKIPKWSTRWVWLQILSLGCLLVTIAAAAANIVDVFLKGPYKPFMPNRY